MSGSKYSEASVGDGAAVLGAVGLIALGIPVAAGVLACFAGKVLVQGTVGAANLTAQSVRKYQQYQAEQKRVHEEQIAQKMKSLSEQNVRLANAILTRLAVLKQTPFLRDESLSEIEIQTRAFLKRTEIQTLDQSIAQERNFRQLDSSLQEMQASCSALTSQMTQIKTQMTALGEMIRTTSGTIRESLLTELQKYERQISGMTIRAFPSFKAQWSSWQMSVSQHLKTLSAQSQACTALDALWNSLPVSQTEAQSLAPVEYAQLMKIDQFIRSQQSSVLVSRNESSLAEFQNVFKPFSVRVRNQAEAIRRQQQADEKIRCQLRPQLDELSDLWELANTESVQHWSNHDLTYLRSELETLRTNLANSRFESIAPAVADWKQRYESMLTDAGIKQHQYQQRQYIVRALQEALPQMGLNIQSVGTSTGDQTVIKVTPGKSASAGNTAAGNIAAGNTAAGNIAAGKASAGKKRITITIPHNNDDPVNYKFDGFSLKKSLQSGRPIVENDDGKAAVRQIAAALLPYGIKMSEPDWPGNPEKIRKGAREFPNQTGPQCEEELEYTQEEKALRHLDWGE